MKQGRQAQKDLLAKLVLKEPLVTKDLQGWLDYLVKEVFLVLMEQREDVETTAPQVQREVQAKWEREDSKALLVPQDPQGKLEVPVTLVLQELLERLVRQE